MRKEPGFAYRLALLFGDAFAIVFSFAFAYYYRINIDHRAYYFDSQIGDFVVANIFLLPVWIIILATLGLYSKNITKASVWTSYAIGVLFTVANMQLHFIKSPINAGAVTMLLGLVVVPLVSLVTPKPDRAMVDEIFTCYDSTVVVKKSRSLEE